MVANNAMVSRLLRPIIYHLPFAAALTAALICQRAFRVAKESSECPAMFMVAQNLLDGALEGGFVVGAAHQLRRRPR